MKRNSIDDAGVSFVKIFWATAITVLLTGGCNQPLEISAVVPNANSAVAAPTTLPITPATPAQAGGNTPTISSTSSGLTGKRGIASGAEVSPALSPQDLQALSPAISWWYNWGTGPSTQAMADATAALGMEFVPMIFTGPFDANAVSAAILPQSRYLLTFNEPNFNAQGNLTPEQAATLWPAIERLADEHNLAIVSPALNYCGGGCNETDPMVWFDAFFAACPNCRVDYLALHAYVCYGSALTSVYLDPFWEKYKKQIWLTEFSCLDGSADASDLAQQTRYMNESVALLEADEHVFRYAWFIARTQTLTPPLGLLGAQGNLTSLGKIYTTLPAL